jgi:hypothetical protein
VHCWSLRLDYVCKPKDRGGIGILNLENFASALRMR